MSTDRGSVAVEFSPMSGDRVPAPQAALEPMKRSLDEGR